MTRSTFTSKQAYMLFLLACLSPSVRVLPLLCGGLAGSAGWVSVILSCGVYCVLTALLHRLLLGRGQSDGLWEVYCGVLGKPAGTALCAVYAIWMFILIGLYLRIFAERFATSILPGIPYEFFMIVALALFYVILSGTFGHFMSMVPICFYAVIICYVLIFFAKLPAIRPENLLPVTTLDAMPVLYGMYPALGVYSYVTFLMFSAGEISDKPRLKKDGLKSAAWLLFTGAVIFLVTVGVFGPGLTGKLTLPFFMSIKTIRVLGSLERLESVFTIFWIISDVAVITMLAHVLLGLIGKLARPKNMKTAISPLLLGAFVFAMYIVSNIFEIADFSSGFGLAVNVALGIGVPALVLAIGKLLKKVL